MDEQLRDVILKNISYEFYRDFWQQEEDFAQRYSEYVKRPLDIMTLAEIYGSYDAFSTEKKEMIAETMKRIVASKKSHDEQWQRFDKMARSTLFHPLKTYSDAIYADSIYLYVLSAQALAYSGEANRKAFDFINTKIRDKDMLEFSTRQTVLDIYGKLQPAFGEFESLARQLKAKKQGVG